MWVAILWASQVAAADDLPPSTDPRVQVGPREVYAWRSYTRGLRDDGIEVSFEGVNAPSTAEVVKFRGRTVFVSMAGFDNPLDLVVKPLRETADINAHLEHLADTLSEATGCEMLMDGALNSQPVRVANKKRPARDLLVDLVEADGRGLVWDLTRSTTMCFYVLTLAKTWTPRERTFWPKDAGAQPDAIDEGDYGGDGARLGGPGIGRGHQSPDGSLQ